MYTIDIKCLFKRSQNYSIHPLGAAKRPPKGILLSSASFRQPFYPPRRSRAETSSMHFSMWTYY